MIQLKAQIERPESKQLKPKNPLHNYQSSQAHHSPTKRQNESSPQRKMEYQNPELAGVQERFFNKSPFRQSTATSSAQKSSRYDSGIKVFGHRSKRDSIPHIEAYNVTNFFDQTKNNIFPAAPPKLLISNIKSAKVSRPLGFQDQTDQKRNKVYSQLKRQIHEEFNQMCQKQMIEHFDKNSVTAYFTPSTQQQKVERKLNKHAHTRSSIICIPGEQYYRQQKEDTRSKSREDMYLKRNRSVILDIQDQQRQNDDFQEFEDYSRRIQHSAHKNQISSLQIMYQGPFQKSHKQEINGKSRGNSPNKNESSQVDRLIRHENLRFCPKAHEQFSRSPRKGVPEGIIDQRNSSIVIE